MTVWGGIRNVFWYGALDVLVRFDWYGDPASDPDPHHLSFADGASRKDVPGCMQ